MPKVGTRLWTVLVAATLLLTAAAAAAAAHAAPKSIFDDDWVPPKPVAKPAGDPAAVTPTPTPDPAVKPPGPAPASKPPTPGPPPLPDAPAERRPIPTREEQAAVRKLMREVFAEQLADASPAARRKLADTLLAQAERSAAVPVDRFVLLAATMDAAVEGGALPVAFRAADSMGAAFDVDPLALKVEKVAKLSPRAVAAGGPASDDVAVATEVADRLADADDYAAAAKVLAAVQPVAAVDTGLREHVQRATRRVAAARLAHDRVARHLDTLKTVPADPGANLAVGEYLCFVKGDWAGGLPKLFRGSDARLKRIAEQELLKPADAAAQAALADAWWDAAATAAAAAAQKADVQAHAADWYERAMPGLQGLVKARAEKRVEAARAAPGARPAGAGGLASMVAPGARPATMQELYASANDVTVAINGKVAMPRANRDAASHLTVGLRAGDVIAVKSNNPRFDIFSFWLGATTPKGEFLFETSDAWTSYVPADPAGAWWECRGPKVSTAPVAFVKDTREYVNLVKAASAKTPAYRRAQPIVPTIADDRKVCYLYYVVTDKDLLPKRPLEGVTPGK
jgi:hypothetical protein